MIQRMVTGCVVALLSAAAVADRLVLLDGRTIEGVVTVQGDTVSIRVAYGSSLRYSKSDVRQIHFMDTPEAELAKKLAALRGDDVAGLFALARWAETSGLRARAKDLLRRVIVLNGDHAEARRLLGFVKIDRRWHTFAKALELCRSKLAAGRHRVVQEQVVPALARLPLRPAERMQVEDLLAHAQLQARQFAAARKTFAKLATKAEGSAAFRYAAIVEILNDYPDGMYILTEPYPPTASLIRPDKASLKPGPASLSRRLVLDAALRDRAKKQIEAARKLLDQARKLELSDQLAAGSKYLQAARKFQRAGALVPKIADSYQIEIARRRIAMFRKLVDADAAKFDRVKDSLGEEPSSSKAYHNMVMRMVHHLDKIRETLREVLTVAKPYPRELAFEIEWAQSDLRKIEQTRKVLHEDVDGSR